MPSRRHFLGASALALPALTLGRLSATAAPAASQSRASRGDGLKLGAVTYNIAKDWDVETIITNLTEVGMQAVELRTTHAHGVEISLSPAQRADVRQRFAESPIDLASLGTICEYHAEDSAVLRKNIDETAEWVKLAHDVGAASIKVRPNGLRTDVPPEKSLEQIGRALKECGAVAADHDVRIQLEVHGRETSRLPNIRRILDHADDHPNVWICWNSNQDDLRDGGLESNFKLVEHKIGQVHMRDLYVEEYPWRRLIGLLHGIEFPGYCYAELGQPSCDGVRVLRYFRGMFRAFEGIEGPRPDRPDQAGDWR
jgi:sugar phosphate isomerase/epimerase